MGGFNKNKAVVDRRRKRRARLILLLCFLGLAVWNLAWTSPSLSAPPPSTTKLDSKESEQSSLKSTVQETSLSYTFWSSDFHITPIADTKDMFQSWDETRGNIIIDESLSGECNQTCAKNLKVLNKTNGLSLGSCPNELKREFWRVYKDDGLMATVDAFLIHHATGLCEVFMAFGRPMIIIVSTRYEIGRRTPEAWKRLNENLKAIASNPRNTLAANNRYDAEYVKHFTGLDVKVLPNYCGYTNVTYNPTRPQILIGPGRLSFGAGLLVSGPKGIVQAAANSTHLLDTPYKEFVPIRQLYKHYEFIDLASHPAIVLIPYQVSIMSIVEFFRVGIPMFAPSPNLLYQWQQKAKVVSEISWNCVYGRCQDKSQISGHSDSPHGDKDPNDLKNFRYYVQYADFYQWPHIILFDDWHDLFEKLATTDLHDIHQKMMTFNAQQKQLLQREWLDILNRAFYGLQPRSSLVDTSTERSASSWEDAILDHYPIVSEQVHSKC